MLDHLVRVQVFDASGHLVVDLGEQLVGGGPGDLRLSTQLLQADGQAVVLISSPGSTLAFSWAGTASDGALLPPGTYHLRAVWTEPGKPTQETRTAAISVMPVGESVLARAILAPNPAGGAAAPYARLIWTPSPRSAIVRARIFNVAGELIQTSFVDAQRGFLQWELQAASGAKVSDGTYVWALELLDKDNRVTERALRKLAVLRR